MNKRLKQSESRNPDKFNNKLGQTLKSSQRPAVPNGVTQRFSPSLPSTSSICARNEQKMNQYLLIIANAFAEHANYLVTM